MSENRMIITGDFASKGLGVGPNFLRPCNIIEKAPQLFVYFAQRPSDGAIKVGLTRNIPARLLTIQCLVGEPVELLGCFKGNESDETILHHCFEDSRVYGEWYQPTEELLQFIQELPNEEI